MRLIFIAMCCLLAAPALADGTFKTSGGGSTSKTGNIVAPNSATNDFGIGCDTPGTLSSCPFGFDESTGIMYLNLPDGGIQGTPPSANGGVLSIYESTQEGGATTEKQWRISVDDTAGLAAEIDCGLNAQGQLPAACISHAAGIASSKAGNGRTYTTCASLAVWKIGTGDAVLTSAVQRSDVDPPGPRKIVDKVRVSLTAADVIQVYGYHCTGESDGTNYPPTNVRIPIGMFKIGITCVTCAASAQLLTYVHTNLAALSYDALVARIAVPSIVQLGTAITDSAGAATFININETATYDIYIEGDLVIEP